VAIRALITMVSWRDMESRNAAVEAKAVRFYSNFAPYERDLAETLTLIATTEGSHEPTGRTSP